MSTVLEAQRQQERRAAGVTDRAPSAADRRGRTPWRSITMVTMILLGVLLVVIRRSDTRRTGSPIAPAPLPHVQAAAEPAAPLPHVQAAPELPAPAAPSAVHASVPDELPRGRVTEKAPAPPRPNAVPRPRQAPPPRPQAEAPAKVSRAVAPPSLPGAGGVQLKSIHYAAASTNRTVTLSIGTATATLHEGESMGGVEVQLILQDMVYIRNGGSVSAIAATP